MKLVDLTLDVHPQAWAVAHLLSRATVDVPEPHAWMTQTAPWYNCRERGLVFSVGHFSGPVLRIAVFEHRNSDNICALLWETERWGLNPPTIESDGELAYHGGNKWDVAVSMNWDQTQAMAVWVREQVSEFVSAHTKEAEKD